MWKLFFGILLFEFFLYDLDTNKYRKLEVVESNLIMEKIPSSLFLSMLSGVSFLLLLAHV